MNRYFCSVVIFLISTLSANNAFSSNKWNDSDTLKFLEHNFSNSVELRDESGNFFLSNEEAEKRIQSLIQQINPIRIIPIHEGYSEDRLSFYSILQLVSNSGTHRLFYYCEMQDNKYLITKVKINRT